MKRTIEDLVVLAASRMLPLFKPSFVEGHPKGRNESRIGS
jgi:hypothetical protein